MNLYVNSAAKYRDGALNLSKQGIKQIEGKSFNKERKGPHPSKRTYEVIAQNRETNPEFMTGKRFRKKRGGVGKKFKGGKRKKR